MKIICTKEEKRKIIEMFSNDDARCLFDFDVICQENKCCAQCLEDNIKWVIKEDKSK